MSEELRLGPCVPGGYAVVIPVDLDQDVRLFDWPGGDSMSTIYGEIGCKILDLRAVGDLAIWVDEEGALGEDWAANTRATWLACVVTGQGLLVAGTVVVTLAEPDHDGDTQGVTRELAEQIAAIARAVPWHVPAQLTARLREVVNQGPLLMVLDENGLPDGFVV